jgi:hypothetical protein
MKALFALTLSMFVPFAATTFGQEKDFNAYPEHVSSYLKRLYDQQGRQLEYRAD